MKSETKTCKRCQKELPLSAFGTHKKTAPNGKKYDFRRYLCRPCYSAYEAERTGRAFRPPRQKKVKPIRLAVTRSCEKCGNSFETIHPTKKYCSKTCNIRANVSKYIPRSTVKNCEHCGKETTRRRYCSLECWNEARKIKVRQAKNRYLATARGKEQRKTHNKVQNQKRRARLANSERDFTVKDWKSALAYFGHKCAYCGTPLSEAHQDHFVPLSKGGGYTRKNIIPTCPSCNGKKSDLNPIDWLISLPNALIAYARIVTYLGIAK